MNSLAQFFHHRDTRLPAYRRRAVAASLGVIIGLLATQTVLAQSCSDDEILQALQSETVRSKGSVNGMYISLPGGNAPRPAYASAADAAASTSTPKLRPQGQPPVVSRPPAAESPRVMQASPRIAQCVQQKREQQVAYLIQCVVPAKRSSPIGQEVPCASLESFRTNEAVTFRFLFSRSGYVYVFNADAAGNVQCLYPDDDPTGRCVTSKHEAYSANKVLEFPATFMGEPGLERQLFVLTPRPLGDKEAFVRGLLAHRSRLDSAASISAQRRSDLLVLGAVGDNLRSKGMARVQPLGSAASVGAALVEGQDAAVIGYHLLQHIRP